MKSKDIYQQLQYHIEQARLHLEQLEKSAEDARKAIKQKVVFSQVEAAAYLGCSARTIRRKLDAGILGGLELQDLLEYKRKYKRNT